MLQKIQLKIILEKPTTGVDFCLQEGKGSNNKTVQKQRSAGKNLSFECSVNVKTGSDALPVFLGTFVQGTANDRFLYIGIGTFAGQHDSPWSRRLKVPLKGITIPMIQQALADPDLIIETMVPGVGKDGGPNCATVKPFDGWKLNHIAKG